MLKTDYKDDVLNTDTNVNRKFSIVRSDGTVVEQNVELIETTAFKQTGDSFGAKDINATNTAINDINNSEATEAEIIALENLEFMYEFTAPLATDDTDVVALISDDNDVAILADWKYKEV